MEDSSISTKNKGSLHEQKKQLIRLWFLIYVFGCSSFALLVGYVFSFLNIGDIQEISNGLMFVGFICTTTLGAIIGSAVDSSITD